MKELNFEQMAAVEGGGCGLNMLAGAMIGGAVGGAAGAIGGAAVMGVLCLFHNAHFGSIIAVIAIILCADVQNDFGHRRFFHTSQK